MKPIGRLRAIVMSFYSRDLYRDVAQRWRGIGLLYLMLLLAICWLPSAARWFSGLHMFASTGAVEIAKQLPAITITNGVMRANPPGRHVIREPREAGKRPGVMVIIDDSIDAVPANVDEEAAVLTRREFGIIRPSRGNERRVWPLTRSADMDVTPADVLAFLSSLQFWLPPIGYLACVIGSLMFRTAQACLYAAVAQMWASHFGVTMDYRAAMRVATVAVTPVIVARTLLWLIPYEPGWYVRWPAAIVVTILYLRFAVQANASEAAAVAPAASAPV
jgi:hypothetical protein